MAIIGDYAIFAAFVACLLSLVLYFMVWRGKDSLHALARYSYGAGAGFISLALTVLMVLILTHDFRVGYVFSYSSTDLPLGYLIATLWGGQEGTFLLWIFLVAVMGFVMIRNSGRFELFNMVVVNLFILSILVILLKKSPFEYMPVFRSEGAGLNPLLQNFWMVIHPPIMFVGFAATLFPFAFAMTGLVDRKHMLWSEAARKWTLFAWISLGTSLVMGGYWAYKTLGWGGFWAWDPVENSSFIPWIFLTAQIHSLFIKRQRKGLMRFSLLVVSLTFWSVLYGTFLTRSGVLADFSVHSFVDLGINNYLISGMFFFLILGCSLIIWRWQDVKPEPSYTAVGSRSYLVSLGIVIFFLGGILTLLGTSAPLLTRLTETPSNVGLPYYFATMTPIAIAILLLMALFPSYRWERGISRPKLMIIGGATALMIALTLIITGVTTRPIYLLLFGISGWTLVSNSVVFYQSFKSGLVKPAYLSHIGLTLAIIGAAASAGFETKTTVALPQGTLVHANGFDLQFDSIVETEKGFDCHVEVTDGDNSFVANLPHEFPTNAEGVMKKPHVEKFIGFDFYMAPLALEENNSQAGLMELGKGETKTIGKYEVTFHDFDLEGHEEGGMRAAIAELTVVYDDRKEALTPQIQLAEEGLNHIPAMFDYDRASVVIDGVRPQDGSVLLKFSGDFVDPGQIQQASLVVEVSRKPLINLFWLGTIITFLSGAWSMGERRRRKSKRREAVTPNQVRETNKELVRS